MAIGSLAYVLNDAAVRLATEEGLGVYQVLAFRGAAMVVLFAAVGRVRGEQPRRRHLEPAIWARVAAEVIGTVLFFAALVRMEFANAQAILQIVPLLVTLAAAALLGETQMVELISLCGYYTLISFTLNVFDVPLPHGATEKWPNQA